MAQTTEKIIKNHSFNLISYEENFSCSFPFMGWLHCLRSGLCICHWRIRLGSALYQIGEESINGKESVRFGTFGEGINSQLRVGYFFNKTWGIDISAGYLYGEDQLVKREISQKNIANTPSYCHYRWRGKGGVDVPSGRLFR